MLSYLLILEVLSLFKDLVVKSLSFELLVLLVHHLLDFVAPVRLRLQQGIELLLAYSICSESAVCIKRVLIQYCKSLLRNFLVG
jgi:hypothetical protein